MKQILLLILIVFVAINSNGQPPVIQWQKSYGGPGYEGAHKIRATADGGYIIASNNNSSGGDVTGNHGGYDFWIVKVNDTGRIQWQKSLGGSLFDVPSDIQLTTDGGYIICGYSYSNDGNVSGNHGGEDAWIVKINDTGGIVWQKTYGSDTTETASSIQQTTDGGYIFAGLNSGNGGDVSGNHGAGDFWVVKINDTGAIQWQKSLGGSSYDFAYSVQQTSDGGYIVAGATSSSDGNVAGYHGGQDDWVVKLNDTGAIQWQKCLGGSLQEFVTSMQQTFDGGYIFAGPTQSMDGDVILRHAMGEYWVVKLNDTGAIQWQNTYGGSNFENATSIVQTLDSGYIINGLSQSNDGDVFGNHGGEDFWVVKIDKAGLLQWQKPLGGTGLEQGVCVTQISGGYMVGGVSGSNDGDVTGNHGAYDAWVVKLTCNLDAGTIIGLTGVYTSHTITLTDTVTGGNWRVSNGHATISSGVVTGISPGVDTIYYTVTNSCGTSMAQFQVTVSALPTEINPTGNTTLISIAPNPTIGDINIKGFSNPHIKIYNTLGQLIKSAANTKTISISEFPTGLYFVRVFNEQGDLLIQEKVVKLQE